LSVRKLTRHVSVKDVAARSGVSFQTTSKVLNGKGSVAEGTRARILGAARDLGYVPNLLARSLVNHSTRAVGLVAPDFGDHNLSRYMAGAEQEARRRGYGVIITSLGGDGSGGDGALPALTERRVDGILLVAQQVEEDRKATQALQRNVPVVSLHQVPGGIMATVGSDHELTGHLATTHLIANGHRHIATLTGTPEHRVSQSRLRGYRRALEEAGLEFDRQLVVAGNWEIAGAVAATRELFERRPDVTAVFAQNDMMAIGVLSALREQGKAVPADCAVVGCDDIDIAAFTAPPLTTVHVPFYETGEQAMRLLIDMIENSAAPPRNVILPVELVVRASSG
jgi:LacI family transcriptional regulator